MSILMSGHLLWFLLTTSNITSSLSIILRATHGYIRWSRNLRCAKPLSPSKRLWRTGLRQRSRHSTRIMVASLSLYASSSPPMASRTWPRHLTHRSTTGFLSVNTAMLLKPAWHFFIKLLSLPPTGHMRLPQLHISSIDNRAPFLAMCLHTRSCFNNHQTMKSYECLGAAAIHGFGPTQPTNWTRGLQCVFLGYSLTQSAYMCLDKSTRRIYTSRHV